MKKSPNERKLAKIERELYKMAFADIREAAELIPEVRFEDGCLSADSVRLLENLPKNLAAAATSVKIKLSDKSVEIEVKLCDKFKALDMYRQLACDQDGDGKITGEQMFNAVYDYVEPDGGAEDN